MLLLLLSCVLCFFANLFYSLFALFIITIIFIIIPPTLLPPVLIKFFTLEPLNCYVMSSRVKCILRLSSRTSVGAFSCHKHGLNSRRTGSAELLREASTASRENCKHAPKMDHITHELLTRVQNQLNRSRHTNEHLFGLYTELASSLAWNSSGTVDFSLFLYTVGVRNNNSSTAMPCKVCVQNRLYLYIYYNVHVWFW